MSEAKQVEHNGSHKSELVLSALGLSVILGLALYGVTHDGARPVAAPVADTGILSTPNDSPITVADGSTHLRRATGFVVTSAVALLDSTKGYEFVVQSCKPRNNPPPKYTCSAFKGPFALGNKWTIIYYSRDSQNTYYPVTQLAYDNSKSSTNVVITPNANYLPATEADDGEDGLGLSQDLTLSYATLDLFDGTAGASNPKRYDCDGSAIRCKMKIRAQ